MSTNKVHEPRSHRSLMLKTRVWVFIGYLLTFWLLSGLVLGDWKPFGQASDAWFVSLMAVVAFRLLSSPFFKRPSESLAAAFAAALLLAPLASVSTEETAGISEGLRLIGLTVAFFAAVAAALSILFATDVEPEGQTERRRRVALNISNILGGPEVLFLAPAMISILWHGDDLRQIVLLTIVWILVTTVDPFERFAFLLHVLRRDPLLEESAVQVGSIERIDSPSLIRVALLEGTGWRSKDVLACRTEHGQESLVLPLFSHATAGGKLGTGLLVPSSEPLAIPIKEGNVYSLPDLPERAAVEETLLGGAVTDQTSLVGFVVEESSIDRLRFEVVPGVEIGEGFVCATPGAGGLCYYQLLDAVTKEETFRSNPGGKIIATASQLGVPQEEGGFHRRAWLPDMNTAVFTFRQPTPKKAPETKDEFFLGYVPGTEFPIYADFQQMLRYHTAVLGVTGMGKTELVFDIIRHGLSRSTKILCVDFTGEYRPRLGDLQPLSIGLEGAQSKNLAELADAVETGDFGGTKEKRKLTAFLEELHPELAGQVTKFLTDTEENLAIFELEEIANTRATLRATELLISSVFSWAKDNRRLQDVLLVLEEAHTIIPEFNFFSYDKSETTAVLGRIAQIALQGRKYGVGLVLVSQRTALVSKTILSQCNTYISFAMVDKTGLDYMENVCESHHARIIPKLPRFSALVHGAGILSDRPVVVSIPFDPRKKRESEKLNKKSGKR